MQPQYGVVTALVVDVEDPTGAGRIKLSYPWLSEDPTDSGWAPIAKPMAGKNRGFHYLPEVDDEVLVAFEHGDVNHPMVLGFLHNGVDTPPADDVDQHVRRLRSVAGHVFELDDRSGRESVRLHTSNGHQLELHDTDAAVELHTVGGHLVKLGDNPTGKIEVATAGGTTITLDDVPSKIVLTTTTGVSIEISDVGGVTVTSAAMPVSVNALSATVQATSALSLTAPALTVNTPVATFAGVVMCQTLVASSVASATYTPGVGNIW